MNYINCDQLSERIITNPEIQIIDLRMPKQFEEHHIERAINIPRKDFFQSLSTIDLDQPIVLYCMFGQKSDEVALFLEKKYKNSTVYCLQGGYEEWEIQVTK
ncbi:MAG: rhodanese-like domain-containing protein [Bacteroidales bacterium]|nr:rhodanese-like domain-containing protein [Bacteroidales bacterium]